MLNLNKIEFLFTQKKYNLIINIIENESKKGALEYYLIGKSYYNLKKHDLAFINYQKSVDINPYGFYRQEFFSDILNELVITQNINTNRKTILLDSYDKYSSHARGIKPYANVLTLNDIDTPILPDYFLVPNWLSPAHPVYEKINELNIPIISMIVDRYFHAEEHIKANLINSDVIVCMENYAVDLYKKQGFEHVIYISGAGSIGYDPYIYPPIKLEKKYDLVFMGNISSPISEYVYKKRTKIINILEKLKSKFNILIIPTPSYNDYVTITGQSKISLDCTIDSGALNYRMFQTMGMGTLCFAEDDNSMVTELYNNEEDLVLYNENNLEDLISYYINNEEISNKIAKQGQQKTLNNYTHYHFMKKVFDEVEKLDLKSSQKTKLSKHIFNMYSGVMNHYKGKYQEAIGCFTEIEGKSSEKLNNILVEKIYLYEKELNLQLKEAIENIFKNNKNDLLIIFNYISFKKFIVKEKIDSLINYFFDLYKKQEKTPDFSGLLYLPKDSKELYYFKYHHGQLIFKHGINTKEYYEAFYHLLLDMIKLFFKT